MVELREKGSISITQLPIKPLRDVRRVYATFELLDSMPKSDDFIWLTISDELPPRDWYRRAEEIFPNLVRHDVVNSKTRQDRNHPEARDFRVIFNPQELFCEFYSSQNNGKAPTQAQIDLFDRIYKEAQTDETA